MHEVGIQQNKDHILTMDHPPIKYDNDSSSLLSYHAHTLLVAKLHKAPPTSLIFMTSNLTHMYTYRSSPNIIRPSLDAIRRMVVELLKFADVDL